MSAISLKKLHDDFAGIRSEGCDVQLVAGFQECLQELVVSADIIGATASELAAVSGALNTVLQLLDAAHDESISGDALHCLLTPLYEKMQRSLTGLHELL